MTPNDVKLALLVVAAYVLILGGTLTIMGVDW